MLKKLFRKRNEIGADIVKIIEQSREEENSPLTEQEKSLLASAMQFHDLVAQEVCVPTSDLEYVDITDDLETVLTKFKESRFHHLLVIKENIDALIGVINVNDILEYIDKKEEFSLKNIVSECTFVPENLTLPKVVKQMQNDYHQIAVVVDEFGGTAGIITLKDILAEFVGDIEAEATEDDKLIKQIKENTYSVDPRVEIEQLEQEISFFEYEISEEKDNFETLSGLILGLSKKIPSAGEQYQLSESWKVKILDADPRKINLVELIYIKQDETN